MDLQTAFQKTWNEVEITFKDAQIRDHEVFVFTFCKAFESKAPDLHVIYDARPLLDQHYRSNLIIWADEGEPTVIFVGEVKFKPESLAVLRKNIKDLNEYSKKSFAEVLTSHDSAELMKVSPGVEFGCFVVSDIGYATISQSIESLAFTLHELAKFHFACGLVHPQEVGKANFTYQRPLPTGVEK